MVAITLWRLAAARVAPLSPPLLAIAQTGWAKAGLRPITLHECRHTFASLMIAADVNAKALQTFMGDAPITVTLDLYGHLLPGSEDEAAVLLDAYLQRFACSSARCEHSVHGEFVGKSSILCSSLERP